MPSAELGARRPERGSLALARLTRMAVVAARLCVFAHPVAHHRLLISWASGSAARQASREFLQRAHGRRPTLGEQYALFFSFASTIHDRVYFLKKRFELFEVEVEGGEVCRRTRCSVLMGAHLGSFEAMRAGGRHLGHRRVVMAMQNAADACRVNGVFA